MMVKAAGGEAFRLTSERNSRNPTPTIASSGRCNLAIVAQQAISVSLGAYAIPTNLSRPQIARLTLT